MGDDIYFIEQPAGIVFVYSPFETGSWKLSRLSDCQRKKLIWVLHYLQEKSSWVLQDQSPSSKKEIMGLPVVAENSEQDLRRPPMGMWRVNGYRFEVTDRMPWHAPLSPPPMIESPFATVQYSESGNIGRLDTKMNGTAITDEALEELLGQITKLVHNLGRRPTMVLVLHSDAQECAMPAFKHIKRFLDWIQENGPELFLVGRGSAIILRPAGILGHTLVGIIKMVQKMLPPPWPEAIVSNSEEAEAFLDEHTSVYKGAAPAPPPAAETAKPEPATDDLQPSAPSQPMPKMCGVMQDMPPIPQEPCLTAPQMFQVLPNKKPSGIVQPSQQPQPFVEAKPSRGFFDYCCGGRSPEICVTTGLSAPRINSRTLEIGEDLHIKQSL